MPENTPQRPSSPTAFKAMSRVWSRLDREWPNLGEAELAYLKHIIEAKAAVAAQAALSIEQTERFAALRLALNMCHLLCDQVGPEGFAFLLSQIQAKERAETEVKNQGREKVNRLLRKNIEDARASYGDPVNP